MPCVCAFLNYESDKATQFVRLVCLCFSLEQSGAIWTVYPMQSSLHTHVWTAKLNIKFKRIHMLQCKRTCNLTYLYPCKLNAPHNYLFFFLLCIALVQWEQMNVRIFQSSAVRRVGTAEPPVTSHFIFHYLHFCRRSFAITSTPFRPACICLSADALKLVQFYIIDNA